MLVLNLCGCTCRLQCLGVFSLRLICMSDFMSMPTSCCWRPSWVCHYRLKIFKPTCSLVPPKYQGCLYSVNCKIIFFLHWKSLLVCPSHYRSNMEMRCECWETTKKNIWITLPVNLHIFCTGIWCVMHLVLNIVPIISADCIETCSVVVNINLIDGK